jgi:hypothetical protein
MQSASPEPQHAAKKLIPDSGRNFRIIGQWRTTKEIGESVLISVLDKAF